MAKNMNKNLEKMATDKAEEILIAGYYPHIQFHKGNSETGFKSTSFLLFEYGEFSTTFTWCFHQNLMQAGYFHGMFEAKRSVAFLAETKKMLDRITVATAKELVKGQEIRLWGIGSHSFKKDRVGNVQQDVYMDKVIFDVNLRAENGYFPDIGSAYIWEIRALQTMVDGVPTWRPFDLELTGEERDTYNLYKEEGKL